MDWNKRKTLPGIRGNIARLVGRYEAVPARHRLFVSSWAFLLCLGGLYWTDYLMEKYPPTETELQRIQEAKKEWRNLRIPSIAEFQAARAQAEAAQIAGATGKRDK